MEMKAPGYVLLPRIGTLSKDDDDSYENAT